MRMKSLVAEQILDRLKGASEESGWLTKEDVTSEEFIALIEGTRARSLIEFERAVHAGLDVHDAAYACRDYVTTCCGSRRGGPSVAVALVTRSSTRRRFHVTNVLDVACSTVNVLRTKRGTGKNRDLLITRRSMGSLARYRSLPQAGPQCSCSRDQPHTPSRHAQYSLAPL
jgi:hypothetical protein